LKCDLKKNDQNRNNVFISCDWPTPTFFRSERNEKQKDKPDSIANTLIQGLNASKKLVA